MPVKKHFYYSLKTIILLPLIVFFSDIIFKYNFGVETYIGYKIDKIFHFFGGLVISISTAGILCNLKYKRMILLQDEKVFRLLIFGILCFTVIVWEIYEYLVFHPDEHLNYTDTISDMIWGLAGGIIAMVVIKRLDY